VGGCGQVEDMNNLFLS